jgi:thiol-disulfide isomerase/thioredoxin
VFESLVIVTVWLIGSLPTAAAGPPDPKDVFAFRPTQTDITYDIPDAKTIPLCKVSVVREGKASGWVVTSPQGQILRRFMDTNGDNVIDQRSFYHQGIEVYRDIDVNFDKEGRIDQFRWLNLAGTRWGVDLNGDEKIDAWKVLSAEEASREAIRALVSQDVAMLQRVLVTVDDLDKLGVDAELKKKLLDAVADPAAKLRKGLVGGKVVNAKTSWLRFDATTPSVIPAESGRASSDLVVYENSMAIVQNGQETALVQIGEVVRVGDVWKLTSIPQPLVGNNIAMAVGLLMQDGVSGSGGTPGTPTVGISPELQKLYEELQELDKKTPQPTATKADQIRFNTIRADLVDKIRRAATTADDYATWTKQLADSIAVAIQMGNFPEGVQRLAALETEVKKSPQNQQPLLAYVTWRRIYAQSSLELQAAGDKDRAKVQETWMAAYEAFVKAFPKSDESAEAAFQIAMNHEFAGNIDDAKKWYQIVATQHLQHESGQKAKGAIVRLELMGKPLGLVGPGMTGAQVDIRQFKGRVVLVQFWATWCKTCTQDLPQLRALHEEYRGKFEILGVNLDEAATPQPIQAFLTLNGVAWPQIVQPQGQRGPIATGYGLISLPTMFLIDQNGVVVNRGAAVADVQKALPELLGLKKKDTVKSAGGTATGK